MRQADIHPKVLFVGVTAMPPRVLQVLIALFILTAVTVGSVSAQAYKQDEVDGSHSRRGQIVKRMVKSPTGSADEQQLFEGYFKKYYFPSMTQYTPDALEKLGKFRADLFKQYIQVAKGQQKQFLVGQSFDWANGVVRSRRYHPAVTYNALLVLGKIDSLTQGPNTGLPTPHVNANRMLCSVVAGAVGGRLPQNMLVGALVGLERHAKCLPNLPAAQQARTTQTLAGVLRAKKLTGDYKPEIRDWIYQQAASGLAATGTAGDRGLHFMAIGKRIADKSVALETRVKLASYLGDLKAEPGKFNASPVVSVVRKLALEVSTEEEKVAAFFEDLRTGGGRGGAGALPRGRSNIGRRIREDEDRSYVLVRSGLIATIKQLDEGLKAVKPLAEGAAAADISKLQETVAMTLQHLMNKDSVDLDITLAIKDMHEAISNIVPVEVPVVKPAAPAGAVAALPPAE